MADAGLVQLNCALFVDSPFVSHFVGNSIRLFASFDDGRGTPVAVRGLRCFVRRPGGGPVLQFPQDMLDEVSPGRWEINLVVDVLGSWWVRVESADPRESSAELSFDVTTSEVLPAPPGPVLVDENSRLVVVPSGGVVNIQRADRAPVVDALRGDARLLMVQGNNFGAVAVETLREDAARAGAERSEPLMRELAGGVLEDAAPAVIDTKVSEAVQIAVTVAAQPVIERIERAADAAATSEQMAAGAADLTREDRLAAEAARASAEQRAARAETERARAQAAADIVVQGAGNPILRVETLEALRQLTAPLGTLAEVYGAASQGVYRFTDRGWSYAAPTLAVLARQVEEIPAITAPRVAFLGATVDAGDLTTDADGRVIGAILPDGRQALVDAAGGLSPVALASELIERNAARVEVLGAGSGGFAALDTDEDGRVVGGISQSGRRTAVASTGALDEVAVLSDLSERIVARVDVVGSEIARAASSMEIDPEGRVVAATGAEGTFRAAPNVGLDRVVTESEVPIKKAARVVVVGVGDVVDAVVDEDGRALLAQTTTAAYAPGASGLVRLGASGAADPLSYDLVVYGATLTGIMAAVRATNRGMRVCVIEPSAHTGGIIAGGITWTDQMQPGSLSVNIGGDTRRYFGLVNAEYGGSSNSPRWAFEPKVGERVANRMLHDCGATVVLNSPIYGPGQVLVGDGRILAMSTAIGWVKGKYFVDASYEMDLGAHAGAPFRLGRESAAEFGELDAGFKPNYAYRLPGFNPANANLFPMVRKPDLPIGSADNGVQSYSFRVIVRQSGEKLPFPKPDGYRTETYALVKELIGVKGLTKFHDIAAGANCPLPGGKFQCNASQLISGELNGWNFGYTNANRSGREAIIQEHVRWHQGLLWYLANDPDCPEAVRLDSATWGLCPDEFQDSPYGPGWAHALYIRESRRLRGAALLRQQDVCGYAGGTSRWPTSVATWRYFLDCHPVNVWIDPDGAMRGEGTPHVGRHSDTIHYEVPVETMFAEAGQGPSNLLVTLNISCTHVAWMPTRMEPLFGMMGEAAGEIVAQCVGRGNIPVQQYDYPQLAAALVQRGSVLKVPT